MTIQRDMSTGLAAGSTGLTWLKYNGTTAAAGKFYGGTGNPSNTTRLNYDGNLYTTNLNTGTLTATTVNATTVTGSGASLTGVAKSGAIGSSGLTINTSTILGRTTAGNGAVEELSLGSGLKLTGTVLDVASSVSPLSYSQMM